MNIDRLSSDLQYANVLGQNIALEDTMRLRLAVLAMREDNPEVDHIMFWGRLRGRNMVKQGLYNDYYIICTQTDKKGEPHPEIKFYWSNDNFKFAPLPRVSHADEKSLASENGYLTGEHDRIIKESEVPKHLQHIDQDDDDCKLPIILRDYPKR